MKLKYRQNKDASGEILRIILSKMSAHTASFNPMNYAVWYEYIAGINPELTVVMKKSLILENSYRMTMLKNYI